MITDDRPRRPNAMGLALLSPDEVRALVAERLASRDWWLLPWISRRAIDASIALETRHYSGGSSADFELVTVPLADVFAVSLAHKRRCTPRQLARLLARMGTCEHRPTLARDLVRRDVLALGDPKETVPRLEAFARWLEANPAARYWRERRN